MLSFDEALERLLALAPALGVERAELGSCDGRVLAEDVQGVDLPSFDYSAMDGYAVRRADLSDHGAWQLPVVGESAAGSTQVVLSEGTSMRISTGAPIPRGADTVVMQEDVERSASEPAMIRSSFQPKKGAWIRRRGEDLAEGDIAIARGTRLGPGTLALAAALDRCSLAVTRRPAVTVLASGDELRSPGEPPRAGSIVESNGTFVTTVARRLGANARLGPFVRDDLDQATAAVSSALDGSDLLVTIGGVSVGDHDVMRPALERAGAALTFHRVAMKPGKPLTVARRGSCVVLGLPGNPASASLTFALFGVPLLRAMQGERRVIPPTTRMPVLGNHVRDPGRTEFLRARSHFERGVHYAKIEPNQSSGAVTSFARAELLVRVPAEQGSVSQGDNLEVLRLSDIVSA